MENKLTFVSLYFSEHNKPPVAKVGKDVTIFLPRDTVILNGTNSTDDQKISSYKWNQVRYVTSILYVFWGKVGGCVHKKKRRKKKNYQTK